MAGEGLDYTVEQVAGNSAMANPDAEMTHWKCTLATDAGSISFVVSLSEDVHGDVAPTKDESIALLAADLQTLGEYPDRVDWMTQIASQTGLENGGSGLSLAYDSLTDTAAEFEMTFGTAWINVLSADFAPSTGSAPRA